MSIKFKDSVRPHWKKPCYNKRDWKAYGQSLKNRGNITIWFDEDAQANWNHAYQAVTDGPRKAGRLPQYSDLSIQTCLTFRGLFRLPLRQTEGLVESIVQLLGLNLAIPDHTTLSRRLQSMKVAKTFYGVPDAAAPSTDGIVVMIDSTGLKVMGEKEWMNHKHGTRQVRVWKKLHLAVDEKGVILSSTLTDHTTSDTSETDRLLESIQRPLDEILGDGGYDHAPTYQAIDDHNERYKPRRGSTQIVIPPNIGFHPLKESDHPERIKNQNIIDKRGLENWQKRKGYGRRSGVEGTNSRWKRILGGTLHSRHDEAQIHEIFIGRLILNTMLHMNPAKAQRSA